MEKYVSVFTLMITLSVTSMALSWLMGRTKKETESIPYDKFFVAAPKAVHGVFIGCGIICVIAAIIAYFYTTGESTEVAIFMIILGIICSSISYFAAAQKFEIDSSCNIIKTRSIFGRRKQVTLDEITGVITGGQIFSLIVNNKRFASISKDAVGIPQFLSWCREKSIPTFTKNQFLIQKRYGKQLTKFKLLLQANKPFNIVALICLTLIVVGFVAVAIFNPESIVEDGILLSLYYFFSSMFLLPVPVLIVGILIFYPKMKIIKDQEKALNFNFDYEDFTDHDKWFIDTTALELVAIRRDYIKDIGEIKVTSSKGRVLVLVNLIVYNNEVIQIKMTQETSMLLKKWFYGEINVGNIIYG